MPETVTGLLETAFTGPVWPASVMLSFLLLYSVLILVGAADADLETSNFGGSGGLEVEAGDVGTEPSSHGADALGSIGATTVRWLNLSRVPLFVWGGVFGFLWWVVSLVLWESFDSRRYEPTLLPSLLLTVRNVVIAVAATKLATGPMTRWFERNRFYRADQLIGSECEISTGEATPLFGRAKYKTDAAPLLLNVRTNGETLVKGQRAKIVDFDAQTRIYTVQSSEAKR